MASCSGAGERGYHNFTLNVSETSVSDGEHNYSTVSWELVLSRIKGNMDWSYGATVPVKYKVNIDGNEYTGNIMSYDGISTVTVDSGSLDIGHNPNGTKSISFSFEVWDNVSAYYLPGYASGSGSMDLTTIGRYANITSFSVSKRDETSVQFNFSTDVGCDWAWYSTDGGSNWANLDGNTGIVYGLSANTTYNFKLRVRRTDSQLTKDSDTVQQTTYDYPKPTSVNNFTIGDGATVNLYNPLSRNVTLQLISNNDGSVIGTYSGTYSGYVNAEFKTTDAINRQYVSIPNSKSGTYYAKVTYGNVEKTLGTGTYYARESDCKPSVSAIFKDIKQSSITQTGNDNIIVKGISNMQVSVSTTLKYNAYVKSYLITCGDGQSGTSQNTVIYRPKSPIVRVTVTDSRDFSDTADYDLTTLNQWLNYIELAYTSDIDIKRSEQLSDQVILNVQGNYFNGKLGTTAGLRNVHVGDDLSGKTIYFDFYGRIHYLMKHYDENNKDIIVADKKITQELFENQSGNDEAIIKAGTTVLYDAEYINDPVSSYEYDIVNLDHLDLPNDFGIVTAINDELLTYGDIYILSDDTPVDNNNSLSMYFQYKLSGTDNWSNTITINPTISGNGFYVNNLILGNNFDHNNEYVFRVITSDKLMQIGDYSINEQIVTKATPIVRIGDEFVQVNGDLLIGESSLVNQYSTSEVKTCLKWIDGKPIYRKVFNGNITDTTNVWVNLQKCNLVNVDNIINISGTIKNTSSDRRVLSTDAYESTSYHCTFSYLGQTDYLQCFVNGWTYTTFGFKYIVIIEYTKTTD